MLTCALLASVLNWITDKIDKWRVSLQTRKMTGRTWILILNSRDHKQTMEDGNQHAEK